MLSKDTPEMRHSIYLSAGTAYVVPYHTVLEEWLRVMYDRLPGTVPVNWYIHISICLKFLCGVVLYWTLYMSRDSLYSTVY